MSKTIKIKKQPVLPFYMAAIVWPVCGFLLPLHKVWGIGVAAVISAAAYFAGRALCPLRVETREVAYATGNADADAVLNNISQQLEKLAAVNREIPDEALTNAMTRMERAGRSILVRVEQKPEQYKIVRRFANYYLPDSIKILETYAQLERQQVKGENADRLRADVRANTATIAGAFEKQLDSLYADTALDISTDLEVLQSILQGQGLV